MATQSLALAETFGHPFAGRADAPGAADATPYGGGANYSPDDLLSLHRELMENYEASEDALATAFQKSERDVDYYDGKQLTEAEYKAIKDRGQPPMVKNMVKGKVDYLQGLERSQRTEPRALPTSPAHEEDAHAATDALRSVTQENIYDQIRSKVWLDMLRAGWGGVQITIRARKHPEQQGPTGQVETSPKVVIKKCAWDRMFWDPFSCEEDFSDAEYLGLIRWVDRTRAVREYGPKAGRVFDETVTYSAQMSSYEDKPKNFSWVDRTKRVRIRIIQMYHRDAETGEWRFCEFTKGGFLKYGPSPWLDDEGEPEHPFVWRSSHVDRDNNRYGSVRDLIDTQDAINKRESKLLHHANVRQTFGAEDSVSKTLTTKQLRTELAKPDGHIPLRPGAKWGEDFGIIEDSDMVTLQFQLLQESKADMLQRGPNAAMLGKGAAGASGRAILANQQGGELEASPVTDTLRDLDHECYRKIWRRIRQFWTAETWVRVTDDERNVRFAQLNKPLMRPAINPATGQPVMQLTPDPQTGQMVPEPAMEPVLDAQGQPIAEKPVAELGVDITLSDAPAVATLQGEQFEALVTLKKFDANNEIPLKEIVRAMPNLRGKNEIVAGMEQREQEMKAPNPAKQMAEQLQMAGAQAEVAEKQAKAQKTAAEVDKTVAQTEEIKQEIAFKPVEMAQEQADKAADRDQFERNAERGSFEKAADRQQSERSDVRGFQAGREERERRERESAARPPPGAGRA